MCVFSFCGCGCTGAGVCLRACSLTNPACNAPPYCHLCPLWLHHIFRLYLVNGTIFWKKVIERKMCVLVFSTTFVSNISHSKKNSARYCHKCTKHFHVKYPLILTDFNETLNLSTDFWKKLKYQISSKSVQWQLNCSMPTGGRTDRQTDRQTGRHDEANSRFSQFLENAWKRILV